MNYKFADRMMTIKASAIREILKATADPQMISFAGGNPAVDAFPVEEIKRISAELFETDPVSILQYGITEGDKDCLEEALKFFNRHECVVREFDKAIMTSGSQQIMEFAAKCLCNEGDVILCENPSFLGALNAFKSEGAILQGIDYKQGEINVVDVENKIKELDPKFIYVIPNYQNPTGMTMSRKSRQALLELAVKYDLLILEDNPYGDLRFEGDAIPSIKSMDETGHVIYAASLSKILAPGMRLACCIAPSEVIEKFVVCKQASDVHSNLWSQKVMAKYLKECDIEKHIERIQKIYKQKCDLMYSEMKREFHKDVEFEKPTGGMFIWVTLPKHINMNEFVKAALEKKVAVVPGNAFLDDDTKECHSFRMNFSTPTDEKIKQGVKILGELSHKMN